MPGGSRDGLKGFRVRIVNATLDDIMSERRRASAHSYVGANAATCFLNNPVWFYFATMERARIFTMLTVITGTSGEQ